MAKTPPQEYLLGFKVTYISFNGHPIHREDVRALIKETYTNDCPWMVATERKHRRPFPRKKTLTIAPASVISEREIYHDMAFAFGVMLTARVTAADLDRVEQYRISLAKAIRDNGHDGLWNVNVEVRLTSAEPCIAIALNEAKYWEELRELDTNQ